MKLAIAALVLVSATSASAQKVDVTIIDRYEDDTGYTYVVPGHPNSDAKANLNCNPAANNAVCNGSMEASGTTTPEHKVSYHVRGTTLSLKLPDGRVAVVNCEGKFKERLAGPSGNQRNCRVPLVDNITAEFKKGDKAKLVWAEGKKTQSETYNVLAFVHEK